MFRNNVAESSSIQPFHHARSTSHDGGSDAGKSSGPSATAGIAQEDRSPRVDLTHVIERRGRPYTLVCTKTQGAYERKLKAYGVDLDQLAEINAIVEWHDGLQSRGR
jgi:hypothetical protein